MRIDWFLSNVNVNIPLTETVLLGGKAARLVFNLYLSAAVLIVVATVNC